MTDLVILTDEPAPYREPVFQEIARRVNLVVVYVSESSLRGWDWWRYLRGHDSRFASKPRPAGLHWMRAIGRLWRLLEETRPRAMVVGGWHLPTSWAALVYAGVHGIPTALWVESTLPDARRGWKPTDWLKRALQGMTVCSIVPGTRSAEYVARFGARWIETAPNAVNNADFAPKSDDCEARSGETITYIGRLAPEKGLDTLVAAATLLRQRYDFKLLLVGDGPERSRLEEAFANAGLPVHFVGPVFTPDAVARILWTTDALVLPSTSEPWGLVVNEAMAAEVPAVITDVVGSGPDLISPGLNGEIFRAGDAEALSVALERVLRRGRSQEVRAACRASAERHSPLQCANGFLRFFERASGRASA